MFIMIYYFCGATSYTCVFITITHDRQDKCFNDCQYGINLGNDVLVTVGYMLAFQNAFKQANGK